METKINIAEILKDKPQGTKLYSSACGKCELKEVDDKSFKVSFYSSKFGFMNDGEGIFDKNGNLYDDGECIIFPSKEMRDWGKFAWKKGDVLVNKDESVHIIFEKFEDDAYKNFHGQYYLWEEGGSMVSFEEDENYMQTSDFNKANKEDAQEYIYKIEKILGGKLNRETLEIEKAQPEFKDWDFITIKLPRGRSLIGVFKAEDDKKYYLHANLDSRGIITIYEDSYCQKNGCIARLSTEEEKAAFFDALAKNGKTWDAVKKQIVKQKWTPKPFDRVITRNADDDIWTANIFSHMDSHGEYVTIGCVGGYTYCIPYNEETAKLIGTTNNWEGLRYG